MEMNQRLRPIQSAFALTLDDLDDSTWKSVSGLEITIETVDDQSTDNKAFYNHIRHVGQVDFGDITLTRGFGPMNLYKWFEEVVINGQAKKEKNGSITAYAGDLKTVVARWEIIKAWPKSIASSDLSSSSSELMVETLTLNVESIERKQ